MIEFDPDADVASPTCPEHLATLLVVGDEQDGSDARFECPVAGCGFAQIA